MKNTANKTPKVGERVHLAKYAGILIEGEDGRHYRLCQDVDVAGVISNGESK